MSGMNKQKNKLLTFESPALYQYQYRDPSAVEFGREIEFRKAKRKLKAKWGYTITLRGKRGRNKAPV